MPIASLTISAAIRRPGQPTARMIPISWIRSKTDMAMVFVTPMPPTIRASSEKIQPALMISRLDVSTLTTCPGSVTAVVPGKRCSTSLAMSRGRRPSWMVTPNVVTSPGRAASLWTTGSGRTAPMSSKWLPEW